MYRMIRNNFALALVLLGLVQTAAQAQQFNLDSAHCWIMFEIRHQGVANAFGQFTAPTGRLVLDSDPAKISLQVEVKADSVITGNTARDNHLKGPDFFDARQFPTIGFKSTSVKKAGEDLEVTGDLSFHGVTKPITVTIKKTERDAGRGGVRAGLETTFTIKRSDYGMSGMQNMLGDEVKLHISLEGQRQ